MWLRIYQVCNLCLQSSKGSSKTEYSSTYPVVTSTSSVPSSSISESKGTSDIAVQVRKLNKGSSKDHSESEVALSEVISSCEKSSSSAATVQSPMAEMNEDVKLDVISESKPKREHLRKETEKPISWIMCLMNVNLGVQVNTLLY